MVLDERGALPAHVVDAEGPLDRGKGADIPEPVWALNALATLDDWGE